MRSIRHCLFLPMVIAAPLFAGTAAAFAQSSGTDDAASVTSSQITPEAVSGAPAAINHVVFMLQENHTFDNYFGLLNPYRRARGYNVGDDGHVYNVDGIDDKLNTTNPDDEGVNLQLFKLKSTCIDDATSSWLESYGDVNRYNFLSTRPISMNGFVHTAEGFAKSCAASHTCSGSFTDLTGRRAMGYYDAGFLNYYYNMASQFAVSDRWFSPMSSKSIPNRIATFSGGTTQGLVFDPGSNDHLPGLNIPNIFQELDNAHVSWRIYYSSSGSLPNTTFSYFTYAFRYLYRNPSHATCTGTTKPSSVVGDSTNSFCIDPNHIAPISFYFNDLSKGTLASFSFIESGSGINDEHPGSGQSILTGQAQVAKIVNALMKSTSWKSSVFFLSYDEGGGPYDHVPPVPGHSNDKTSAGLGTIPDISSIAVNADGYKPCVPSGGTPTLHCDLNASSPGAHSGDAPAVRGFSAQLGFRVPNIVISPFTRRHYVSHTPLDHTAIIKFVENRFIGSTTHLTARDAAQPDLLEFFDFTRVPWATPPIPPSPVTSTSLGYNPCTPANMGP
jgi:phospholipase C